MSAEEVLTKLSVAYTTDKSINQIAILAMNEFAQQEAIEFAELLAKNYVPANNEIGKWFSQTELDDLRQYTTVELYTIFKSEQQ